MTSQIQSSLSLSLSPSLSLPLSLSLPPSLPRPLSSFSSQFYFQLTVTIEYGLNEETSIKNSRNVIYLFWQTTDVSRNFFFTWRCSPAPAMASSFTRFLDHTQRRTTIGKTPLDQWSARRRDLYLTTHNTHNRQTDIHASGGIRT
jgi:hypothetical protein